MQQWNYEVLWKIKDVLCGEMKDPYKANYK